MTRTELSAAIDDWWSKRRACNAAIEAAVKARDGFDLAAPADGQIAAYRAVRSAMAVLQVARASARVAERVLASFDAPVLIRLADDNVLVFHRGRMTIGGRLFERPAIDAGEGGL